MKIPISKIEKTVHLNDKTTILYKGNWYDVTNAKVISKYNFLDKMNYFYNKDEEIIPNYTRLNSSIHTQLWESIFFVSIFLILGLVICFGAYILGYVVPHDIIFINCIFVFIIFVCAVILFIAYILFNIIFPKLNNEKFYIV